MRGEEGRTGEEQRRRRTAWRALGDAVRLGRRRLQDGRARRPTAGTARSCRGRTRRRALAADRQRSSGRMPSTCCRRSRRRRGSSRAGAWRAFGGRWCRRCRARRRGESALVGYDRSPRPSPATRPAGARDTRRSGGASPVSTNAARSGAVAAAAAATAGELRADRQNRARESRSSSARSGRCIMVDTGTGTAPMRIAARKSATKSGRVGHEHQQPLLGPQRRARAGRRRCADAVEQLGVGEVAARARSAPAGRRRRRRRAGRAGRCTR